MPSKPTLSEIDSKLSICMNNITKIDEKIRELRKFREKYFDRYNLYRFYKIRFYHRDVLSMGLNTMLDDSNVEFKDAGVNVNDTKEITEEVEEVEDGADGESDDLDDLESEDEDDEAEDDVEYENL